MNKSGKDGINQTEWINQTLFRHIQTISHRSRPLNSVYTLSLFTQLSKTNTCQQSLICHSCSFIAHLISVDVRDRGMLFVNNLPIFSQSMHRSCDKPVSTHFLLSCFTVLPKSNFKVNIIPVGRFMRELWRMTQMMWGCITWVQHKDRWLNCAEPWFEKGGISNKLMHRDNKMSRHKWLCSTMEKVALFTCNAQRGALSPKKIFGLSSLACDQWAKWYGDLKKSQFNQNNSSNRNILQCQFG